MPTYQYACRSCGHQFEIVQGFQDDALRSCPNCQADELRKVYGSVGVVFKGSGFYRNDSRAGAKSGSALAPAKTDAAASKPSATDTAPAGGGSGESSSATGSTTTSKAPASA